jgi:flagellar biosynthesis chaperone FliJ
MPRSVRTSTYRRRKLYNTIRRAPLVMRPYQRYMNHGLECRKALSSEKYGEYIRVSHPCSLSVSAAEFDSINAHLDSLKKEIQRAREQKQEIRNKLQEVRSKLLRLKRQRQATLEKKGEMVNRELRNIKELKVDEALASLKPLSSSPIGFS